MSMLALSVFLSAILAANAVVNWPKTLCDRRLLYTQGTHSEQMKTYIAQLLDKKSEKANDDLLKLLAPIGGENEIGCPNSNTKPSVKQLIGLFNYATKMDIKSCAVGADKGRYYARLMGPSDYFNLKDTTGECIEKQSGQCKLKSPSYIGYRPVVFGSIPEGYIGKHVIEMMFDVGYDAAGVFDPTYLNKPKVLVIWRYPDDVLEYATTDKPLVTDLAKATYRPTWDNLLAAFKQLLPGAKPDKATSRDVSYLHFDTQQDLDNAKLWVNEAAVVDYIKKTPYKDIKAKGATAAAGSLEKKAFQLRMWLEPCFAAYKLFMGTGTAENEAVTGVLTGSGVTNNKADGSGIPEWMLPNKEIKDLPEVAIIYVGHPTGDDANAIASQLTPDVLKEVSGTNTPPAKDNKAAECKPNP